jgi:PAS domain S-box-containing protein
VDRQLVDLVRLDREVLEREVVVVQRLEREVLVREVVVRGRVELAVQPRRREALAKVFILTVSAAGVAVVGTQVPAALDWSGAQLLAAGALCLATLATELFPLHLRHTTETATFSVTDVVWTAALVLAPSSVLLIGVATGVLLSQVLRRMPLRKVAFNVGQFVVAMGVAEALFQVIPHGGPFDPVTWAAAAAAMSFNFVVNEALVALVISLMEPESFRSVLSSSLGLDVLPAVGNTAIGVIAAVMWTVSPIGVLVAAVPVLLSYLAYAGSLRSLRERDRMRDLYQAGQVLLERLETAGDFSSFLELVARMMDADAAEIVILGDGVVTIHDPTGLETVVHPSGPRAETATAGFHRNRPGTTCQSAAIGAPGPEMGSLAVFRRGSLSPAERSLLEALASQVCVKLRHSAVFSQSVARERELERIISSTSDGIFVIGEDGRITSWSPAMERITGEPAETAVDRHVWDVLVAPDDENQVWRRFQDPARPRTGGIETGAFVREDGTIGWVRFSSGALRSQEGEPSEVVVVARDVSADIQAEQAKANFLAAISHELRTPLVPLKGYLSLFASGQMSAGPEAGESFDTMLRHADRLEHLISDLLDASQMDGGQSVIRREEFDLVEVVAEVAAESERELGARVVFEPSGDPVCVFADGLRVKQVLLNLVSNAIKFSPPDCPIRIEASADDGMSVVSVTDMGSGISVAEQARIFDRFYRVDNGSTRVTGGVGLGLYIAKQLVESMSGRLWVRSEPGCGSTFHFSLPLVRHDELPAAPEARIA